MWWSLLTYPLMFAACIYVGYRSRMAVRSRLTSLVIAAGLGAVLGLAARVAMDLVQSYDYHMSELLTEGIGLRQITFGAALGAWLSAGGWKARGDVERRQMNRPR